MDLPTLFMPAGPMLRGHWGGTTLGSGSDTWKYWADLRAGNITQEDWQEIENGIARSPGHCMTMGTASTMTSAVEALGVTLPGAASIPAADSRHAVMAAHTGRRIVEMVWENVQLSDICTRAAFRNAITTVLAIGGSTNAIIHLIAMARRIGVELGLADFEELGRRTPLLGNIRPSGAYLMEDFFYAGGLPALLNNLGDLLDTSAMTANGQTLGENIARAKVFNDDVIRPRDNPVVASDTLAVLFGNLAPDGAVIKPPAAEPRLHRHAGPAVVFANYDDMAARIDDPDLEVDENSVLVLQERRPAGRARDAGMGAAADPEEAAGAGGAGHGAHLRCPDVRAPATGPACCTWPRSRSSAARWPSSRTATSSSSTWPPAADPAASATRSWTSAAPTGSSRRPSSAAATARSTCNTSPRPTRAATSTSSKPDHPPPNPRSTERGRHDRSQPAELPRPSIRPQAAVNATVVHNPRRPASPPAAADVDRQTSLTRGGPGEVGTVRLTVAQALVRFLANQYSERDGVRAPVDPGVLGDLRARQRGRGRAGVAGGAVRRATGRARRICRITWPATSRAWCTPSVGFARMRNRLQAMACTASIGPGSTNMLTGAALATTNRIPVLLLASDIFATRVSSPVLQELELPSGYDISVNDAFRPLSRFFDRVWRPEQLPAALLGAMRVLTDPAETGAVTLALPQDVQAEAHDWPEELFARRVWHIPRPVPEPAALARAVEVIRSAQRPLLIAGGGVHYSEATEALRVFAEATGIPVADTQAGKGAILWDHPQAVGGVGSTGSPVANALARDADVVIGVGTRYSDFTTASRTAFQHPGVRFVNLNVAGLDAAKHAGVMLLADARTGLEALTDALSGDGRLPGRRTPTPSGTAACSPSGTRSWTTPTTSATSRCPRRPRSWAR